MRLRVEGSDGPLFYYGDDSENALIPSNEGERAAVFNALTGALALLAGLMPQPSSAAKGSDGCQSTQPISQGHDDRRSAAVVHLATRRDGQVLPSKQQ